VDTNRRALTRSIRKHQREFHMSDWQKRADIRDVLNGYSGAASRLDIRTFMSFFTPDAEVHGIGKMFNLPDPFKGAQEIEKFFGNSLGQMEWLVQMNNITDVILGPEGMTAKTSTGLIERAKRRNANAIELTGRYDDELKLTDQGWRFRKRHLNIYHFKPLT
jgi:ketosteroid isomerase-like protein